MKIFKKVVSVILASVMCVPSSILSFAYAAETDADGSYTVMLTDTENGIMQFSEECMETSTASQDGYHMIRINDDGEAEQIENDGSLWTFSKGDEVEIELIPDEGYEVSSFSIINSSTGNTIAHEDTTDNVFSFAMPAKNITIEASFAETDNDEDDEKDFTADEENNIIEENEYGETVYRRIELTDEETVSLQDRINSLPATDDLYRDLYMEDDCISEVQDEVNAISGIYFNEMSDNERAQIDPSPLFSAMLVLEASDYAPASGKEPDDAGIQELQDRIDALVRIDGIAEAEMTENDNIIFDYGSDGADMYIPNEEQDELFLEVLDLSKEVFLLDSEYQEKLDTEPLEDLYRFFRGGHIEYASDDGIMLMSESDDGIMLLADDSSVDYTKGWYNRTTANNPYHSSFFTGTLDAPDTDDDDRVLTMYCGNAEVKAFSHAASSVNFTDGGHVVEIKSSDTELDGHNMIRAILYFGYNGPGFEEGKGLADTSAKIIDTSKPEYCTPLIDKLAVGGQSIQGMQVVQYMITHFALRNCP